MTKRLVTAVFVVLLLASAIGPAVAGATPPAIRTADLAIDQPSYVESDVQTTADNGSRVYQVAGEELAIVPQNFAQEDVVDFGIEAEAGTLTYDEDFDEYVLVPEGTGTYQVYWVVNEEIETGSGNNTTTTTRSVRYEAAIRVTGGTDLVHRSAGSVAGLREDAENWREFNSTIHSSELAGPGADTETVVQEMIDWYKLRKSPLEALTGNLTTIVFLIVTTLGGLLLLVIIGFYVQHSLWRLYKRLNVFHTIEAEEGEAKEAVAELDYQARIQRLQDLDWNDIFGDDHVAWAFRDTFGESVLDGVVGYLSATSPRALMRDRLRAMGHDGYVAVVDEAATDGGGDDATTIEAATIYPPEAELPADGERADLATATVERLDDILDTLESWDEPVIRRFDLAAADYDATELDVPFEQSDIDVLAEELHAEMRHFEDETAFAEYLLEFVTTVREHPFTDDEGRIDEVRYAMNHWLKLAQLLDDRFNFPAVHYHREAIERALTDHDPESKVEQLIEDARSRRL